MNVDLQHRLGKYEYAAVISARAQQIANNAPTTLDIEDYKALGPSKDAISIAIAEFNKNRLPLKVKRTYSNGEAIEYDLDSLLFLTK